MKFASVVILFLVLTLIPLSLTAQTTGLVAHYTFDDGTAVDVVAGNNGTLFGPTRVAGKINGGLQFDGVDDYVDLGKGLNIGPVSDVSVAFWVKFNSVEQVPTKKTRIISKDKPGFGSWAVGRTAYEQYYMDSLAESKEYAAKSSAAFNDTNWHQVTTVYTNGTVEVFVDGASAGKSITTVSKILKDSGAKLCLGATGANCEIAGSFNGILDDLRIYNRALTPEEVIQFGGISTQTPVQNPPAQNLPTTPTTPTQPQNLPPENPNLPAPPVPTAWTPPIGIPIPPFGLKEWYGMYNYPSNRNPALTYIQNTEGGYYTHYIKPGTCTDTNNAFGTSVNPRCTIPRLLPAGSVVELLGVYTKNHQSPNEVKMQGTAAQPVFIRSLSSDKASVTSPWEITGSSYAIIENINFRDADGDMSGGSTGHLTVYAPTDHVTIRNNDVSGNLLSGGISLAQYGSIPGINSHNVVYNNIVHDSGNLYSPDDDPKNGADRGGIHISGHNIWVVDNTCYKNGAMCVTMGQYHNDAAVGNALIQNVYVGRNTGYLNREINFWSKQAKNVVFSQNTSYSSKELRNADGRGVGMGFQYGAENIWFLFNHIYDVNKGIAVQSNSTANPGVNSYFIGNVIHDVHFQGTGNFGDAILFRGGLNHYVYNNTIYDVDNGMYTTGNTYAANNIISNITRSDGRHIMAPNESARDNLVLKNNLFFQPGSSAQLTWRGSKTYTIPQLEVLTSVGLAVSKNIEADPKFVNVSGNNFMLGVGSSAIDAGASLVELPADIYTTYQQTFGVDIRKDIAGMNRPAGNGWDIGAYEYAGVTTNPPIVLNPVAGDFNNDGLVNSIDMSLMSAAWNQNNVTYDLTKDGTVNTLDYSIMVRNWTS